MHSSTEDKVEEAFEYNIEVDIVKIDAKFIT